MKLQRPRDLLSSWKRYRAVHYRLGIASVLYRRYRWVPESLFLRLKNKIESALWLADCRSGTPHIKAEGFFDISYCSERRHAWASRSPWPGVSVRLALTFWKGLIQFNGNVTGRGQPRLADPTSSDSIRCATWKMRHAAWIRDDDDSSGMATWPVINAAGFDGSGVWMRRADFAFNFPLSSSELSCLNGVSLATLRNGQLQPCYLGIY